MDKIVNETVGESEPLLISFMLPSNDLVSNDVCLGTVISEDIKSNTVLLRCPILVHIDVITRFVGIKSLMPLAIGNVVSFNRDNMIAISKPTDELASLYHQFVSEVQGPIDGIMSKAVVDADSFLRQGGYVLTNSQDGHISVVDEVPADSIANSNSNHTLH